jgi:hypothetical protein
MRTLPLVLASAIVAGLLGAAESPRVTNVTPSPIVASGMPQTLTVTGTGFGVGLTVEVTSQGNTEVYSGAAVQGQKTSFTIAVVLPQPGEAILVVRNTDGGVSDPYPLKVQAGPAAPPESPRQSRPVIDRVTPDKVVRGSVPQAVTISGNTFSTGLTVSMTDPAGNVTVLKGTALGGVTPVTVKFGFVFDASGEYTLAVTNPPGQMSNTVTINVS